MNEQIKIRLLFFFNNTSVKMKDLGLKKSCTADYLSTCKKTWGP